MQTQKISVLHEPASQEVRSAGEKVTAWCQLAGNMALGPGAADGEEGGCGRGGEPTSRISTVLEEHRKAQRLNRGFGHRSWLGFCSPGA